MQVSRQGTRAVKVKVWAVLGFHSLKSRPGLIFTTDSKHEKKKSVPEAN